jgi:hypothetical protein
MDALEDLVAMYSDVLRCMDADFHLVAAMREHGDLDVLTDSECFANPSSQYEHERHPREADNAASRLCHSH